MTDSINNTVVTCTHISGKCTATLSVGVTPMFAPDDVVIPVNMSTSTTDNHICKVCGKPYVTTR